MKKRNAFTLIELLVVVAIIVLLISILIPAIEKALETARDAKCKTQLRLKSIAGTTFSHEHKGTFPGAYYSHYPLERAWQWSYMGNEVWAAVSHVGTIVEHIGGVDHAKKMYRCPSLAQGVGGSNGNFDYTSAGIFMGARPSQISATSTYILGGTGESQSGPTPWFVEEFPGAINDPLWVYVDRLAKTHREGANYASIDTSVHQINFPTGYTTAYDWRTRAPSGKYVSFAPQHGLHGHQPNEHYGEWSLY